MEDRRLLSHAVALPDCSQHVCVSAATLGMAVCFSLQSWHCAHGTASHEHTWAMMEAVNAACCLRSGVKLVDHIVLASHRFNAHARGMTLPDTWSVTPATVLGRILLEDMAGNTSGACMQTLREWVATFEAREASVLA